MSTIRAIVEVISLTASQPVRRIIVRPAATINMGGGGGGGGGPVDWSEVENKPRVLYVVTTPYPDEDANNYEVGDVALFTFEPGGFFRTVIPSDTPGVNEWDDIGSLVAPYT